MRELSSPVRHKAGRQALAAGLTALLTVLTLIAGVVNTDAASPPSSYTIWPNSLVPETTADPETNSVELGTVFSAAAPGAVSAIRFYKDAENYGPHVGRLWSSSGAVLAEVNFTNETASGWQVAQLADPLPITAGERYTVSYRAPYGRYADDQDVFSRGRVFDSGLLRAYSGVYTYWHGLPTLTWNASSYYVDVVFTPRASDSPTLQPPPTTSTSNSQPSWSPTTTKPTATTTSPTAAATAASTATATVKPTTSTTAPDPTTTTTSATQPPSTGGSYPNASNSGVPAGTDLAPYAGALRITNDNTIIDSKKITGCLDIQADNVTIKNSLIQSRCFFNVLSDSGNKGLKLTDVEIDGLGNSSGDSAIAGDNYACLRCDIHGVVDGAKAGDNVVFQDSYIHDLAMSSGSHNDGIQSLGTDSLQIDHNTIIASYGSTSAIILSTGSASQMRNILIESNLLGGGAYTVYGGYLAGTDSLSKVSNISIKNNRFTTAIYPRSGAFGALTSVDSPVVCSSNTWFDGPNIGKAVNW